MLLTGTTRILLLGLLAAVVVVLFGRAATPASAVGEGTFGLDAAAFCPQIIQQQLNLAPGYCVEEGTAVPVTVYRAGGAVLTQDVEITVQLSDGTVDEDYPSGTITQTYKFKQGTNETSKTFMFQTLNKSRYFTRTIRVTILSVTAGGLIQPGASTAPIHILGIFMPTVSNVAPRSAISGANVTITGTNFPPVCSVDPIAAGDPPCTNKVLFYPAPDSLVSLPATIWNRTDQNHLVFQTPGGLVDGVEYDIVVEVQTGISGNNYTRSLRSTLDRFTYTTGATITNVFPNNGPSAGNTSVLLTGNQLLTCASPIRFGGVTFTATNCETVSTSATVNVIRVRTPAHSPGTVDVVQDGAPPTRPTAETKYTYTGGPQITSITPAFGPDSGGTIVTIVGTGFAGGTLAVSFGGVVVPPADFSQPLGFSDTRIIAKAPPGAGTQQITVSITIPPLGTFVSPYTTAANFTYTTGPIIHTISPNNGPVTGGTVVTINGTGFLGGATVKFGANLSANVLVDSSTSIRAVAPAGAGNVDIVVTVNGVPSPNTAADNFSYTGPTITLVTPNGGPIAGGNQIAVKGLNFTSGMTVKFGSVVVAPDKVIFVSQNEITVTVPVSATAQSVDIRVTTISGESPIVFEDLYTYTNGPIVDAVNPNSGPTTGGTIVIITGKNFTAGLTVSFGGANVENLNVNSATQITVLTPPVAGASVRDVRVTKGGDTSPINNNAKFNYLAAVPIITTLEPNTSSTFGGQEVTIIGAGFSGAVCPGAVKFGTVPASSCSVVNDTTMKAVSPPNISGQTVVTVTTTNGTSEIAANFTYKSPSSGTGGTGGTGGTAPPAPGPAGTITYTLTFRWTLLTWSGRDGIAIGDALRGFPPTAGSDVTSKLSAIFRWDAANSVYRGYFVGSEGIPGANDFTTLTTGAIYWISIITPGQVQWTVQQN